MEQELHVLNKPYTLHKHSHTQGSVSHCGGVVTQSAEPTHCTMSTIMIKRDLGTCLIYVTIVLGDLCDNKGSLVYLLSEAMSHSPHDQAIPILSPLLFMHVGHPYIQNSKNF